MRTTGRVTRKTCGPRSRDIVIGGVWPPADVIRELLGTAGPGVSADPGTFIAGLPRRTEDPDELAGS